MALRPVDAYGIQVETTDPAYPLGKARNATTPGDGTGFPLERRWINDLLGFEQALLTAAGIVASGDPDKVGASQYLEALQKLFSPTTLLVTDDSNPVDIPSLYPWAKHVRVQMCGGGGGAGAGNNVPGPVPGAGGGSGFLVDAIVEPQVLTFAFGAAGAGATSFGTNGGDGGDSTCDGSLGVKLRARGGRGGQVAGRRGGDGYCGGGARNGSGGEAGSDGEGSAGFGPGGHGIAFLLGSGSSMAGGEAGDDGNGFGGGGGGGGHFVATKIAQDGQGSAGGEAGLGYGAGGGGGYGVGDNGGDGAPGAALVTVW